MTKRCADDYQEVHLKILCQEATELEWINRAITRQLKLNENRLAEIDKELAKHIS